MVKKEMIERFVLEIRERSNDEDFVEGCTPLIEREQEPARCTSKMARTLEEGKGEGTRVSSTTQLAPAVPDSLFLPLQSHRTSSFSSQSLPHFKPSARVSFLNFPLKRASFFKSIIKI